MVCVWFVLKCLYVLWLYINVLYVCECSVSVCLSICKSDMLSSESMWYELEKWVYSSVCVWVWFVFLSVASHFCEELFLVTPAIPTKQGSWAQGEQGSGVQITGSRVSYGCLCATRPGGFSEGRGSGRVACSQGRCHCRLLPLFTAGTSTLGQVWEWKKTTLGYLHKCQMVAWLVPSL